ncbi:MAG: TetR/AcrR family transcriptional regulator [Chloroflexota bacterium]|nr:TetR/AcrR family transcriptional regulator [Chloroflexota bacterium]
MARGVRDKMVASAAELLARRGLEGTSFSEVLDRSGAPRGSVYHHFPAGKDQLIGAAIDLAGRNALGWIDKKEGSPPDEIVRWFVHLWRELLRRSRFDAGCAVLAVTVATDSPELLNRAADVFRSWRKRLAELFEIGGLSPKDAARFSALLIASTEGAVVISRAELSLEPLDIIESQLLEDIRRLMRGTP